MTATRRGACSQTRDYEANTNSKRQGHTLSESKKMSVESIPAVLVDHGTPIARPQVSEYLPRHDDISLLTRVFYCVCIVTASALIVWNFMRVATAMKTFPWWLPFVALTGMVAADFASGLIHWTADTWGKISMPILGRRFLHPFRVHHVNPRDFLRRSFLDTNGDVAMLLIPFLGFTLLIPLEAQWWLSTAVFMTAVCAAGLPTNQVHQWSHMPKPPGIVRILQDHRIILSRQAHRRHHTAPHVDNYCIALGWCNPALSAVDFWRRLEQLVTWGTGIVPRKDETDFTSQTAAVLISQSQGEQCDA